MLRDLPAFILGNSPYLPVDDLDCLAEKFTIGVNRIVEVFRPTVLMWVDWTVYQAVGEKMDSSGALMVCDQSVRHRQFHIGLKTWVGEGALKHQSQPDALCCNGNTGCCAARWAISLGCSPVYLVGMEAAYKDGRTDFWGDNPRHRREGSTCTLDVMRKELERLLRDFTETVFVVPDGEILRKVARRCRGLNQEALKSHLKAMLIE